MTTAEKCKKLRKVLHYTQKEFGALIGCSQPMISLIENGWQGAETELLRIIDGVYSFLSAFCAIYGALQCVNKTPKGKGE